MRSNRRGKLRRSWRVVAFIVAAAFAFGFFLPRIVHFVMSSILTSLVEDSEGLAEWPSMTKLSLTASVAFGLAATIGLVRPSHSESAWRKGASGEVRVGQALEKLPAGEVQVLHDIGMPGSRSNIDHVVVTTSGVFTVETKTYAGKLEVRSRGTELWIAGRNRSKILDQARRQSAAVQAILANAGELDVPVTPILCFVETEIPLLFPPKEASGVLICTRKSLLKRTTESRASSLGNDQVIRIAELLERTLGRGCRSAHADLPRGGRFLSQTVGPRHYAASQPNPS